MKIHTFLVLAFALALVGCSTRPVYNAAGAAGGGVLAHELSDGDPLWTAVGAGGGALVAEGLQGASAKSRRTSYNRGYDRGASDAIKRQYWMLQRLQQAESPGPPPTRYVEIPGPTKVETPQGPVHLTPHDYVVPVVK